VARRQTVEPIVGLRLRVVFAAGANLGTGVVVAVAGRAANNHDGQHHNQHGGDGGETADGHRVVQQGCRAVLGVVS
jgi:hypothetical protein